VTVNTLNLNLFAMVMFVVVAFFALRASLKRQLQKVWRGAESWGAGCSGGICQPILDGLARD